MSNKKIEAPNYTQIPNVFFDNIMSKINGSEFKVLMAISRKTFGWHKEIDRISYSQIMEMAGISSKETVNNSIKKLVSKDIIKLEKVGQINYYSINVTEIEPVQKSNQYENCTGDSTKIVPVEQKTGTKIVHTKESNINKVKKNIGIKKLIADKPESVSQEVWDEFVLLRKQKRTTVTPLVIKGIETEAEKAGLSLQDALVTCIERGWQGFKADWVKEKFGNNYGAKGFRISSDNAILKEGECNF